MSLEMVTLTINDEEVRAPRGSTILEVCRQKGIELPTLCHFDCLTPVGACRLCTVEVEGSRRNMSACTTPIAEGMKVRTNTPALREERRQILEMLFAERNHFCPVCPMSGQCELQALAYQHEIASVRYHYAFPKVPVDMSHPDIGLDQNRCILCTRCVRVCSELVGAQTLGVVHRGMHSLIAADLGVPLGESSCLSDGNCMQICPTGSLFDKRSAYRVRPEALRNAKPTICPECSVGCGFLVHSAGHILLRIDGDFDHPVNRGLLCKKGRFDLLDRNTLPNRVPQVRRNGRWEEASWEEAVAEAARGVRRVAERYGPEAFGAWVAPTMTTEAFRQLHHFVREVVGGSFVDTLRGEEWRSWRRSLERLEAMGLPVPRIPTIPEIDTATVHVIVGGDPVISHPVLGMASLRAAANRKATVFVIHPDRTTLARATGESLFPYDGEERTLLRAAVQIALRAGKMTEELAEAIDGVTEKLDLETLEDTVGVPVEQVIGMVNLLFAPETQAVWFLNLTDDHIRSLLPDLMLFAAVASEGPAWIVPLTSGNNLLGAVEAGCVADSMAAPRLRAALLSLPEWRGITPQWLEGLRETEFLVLHGEDLPALRNLADVWLPALPWAYQGGTRTNYSGRAQYAAPILFTEKAWTDEEIFRRLEAAYLAEPDR
ncbi:MAG: formate dehydrogenase subunit alpha [Candidatus Poribacteria bacterium]|nr:MAG: formate dehydrogenase subunit alpha [Candidatus Poribacteria bacterium]